MLGTPTKEQDWQEQADYGGASGCYGGITYIRGPVLYLVACTWWGPAEGNDAVNVCDPSKRQDGSDAIRCGTSVLKETQILFVLPKNCKSEPSCFTTARKMFDIPPKQS